MQETALQKNKKHLRLKLLSSKLQIKIFQTLIKFGRIRLYISQSQQSSSRKSQKQTKTPVTPTSADYLRPVNTPKTSTTSTPKTKPIAKNIQSPVPKNTVTKPVQPKVTQNKPVQKTIPAYNPNDPELLQYKSALRAALFSKFAVGSIQGSGTCIIKFTLNKDTGKLENRAFLKN